MQSNHHTAAPRLAGRAILAAERVALNFMCQLSGIATATAALVAAARPHRASIVCTRKTTPGLRILEKHAIRAGGANLRYSEFKVSYAIAVGGVHQAIGTGVGLEVLALDHLEGQRCVWLGVKAQSQLNTLHGGDRNGGLGGVAVL